MVLCQSWECQHGDSDLPFIHDQQKYQWLRSAVRAVTCFGGFPHPQGSEGVAHLERILLIFAQGTEGFSSRNRFAQRVLPQPQPWFQAAGRERNVHVNCSPSNSQTSGVFVNTMIRSESPRRAKERELARLAALLLIPPALTYGDFSSKILKPNKHITGST